MSAIMKLTKRGAIIPTHTPCLVIANMADIKAVQNCISAHQMPILESFIACNWVVVGCSACCFCILGCVPGGCQAFLHNLLQMNEGCKVLFLKFKSIMLFRSCKYMW